MWRRWLTSFSDAIGLLRSFQKVRFGDFLSCQVVGFWQKIARTGRSRGQRCAESAHGRLDRGDQTVALIRERLKPVKAADKDAVTRLVTKLDAPAFGEREAAAKLLREMGDSAIPALRAALQTGLSAEAKDRVERVIAAAAEPVRSSGFGAQQARAIAVLQRIGIEDARKLLEELAGGLAEARLTHEAAEALQSLRSRASESK